MQANTLNFFDKIPMINQYKMVKIIFKGKKLFIKFPKNTKDNSKDEELLSKHFNISVEKAKEYLEVITKKELEYIRDLYSVKNK